ncbi:helix-turn-helix domain-containing protein [Novosphingobium malaysiense]|uniref:helix-turn-helix domain-containing protein n=1 Tax=Novosphingobium malaysiense TaxID=1348853 RepID=UPI0012E027D0|nr:helix-turn-helix transcriptional regulator [Novosphingobium malaysiense]
MEPKPVGSDPFPYVESRGALMLSEAIRKMGEKNGKSLRSLARDLGYKQSTVLSHMAKGRVPIPLDRAVEIAHATALDPGEFLAAAVQQRTDSAAIYLSPRRADSGLGGEGCNLSTGLEQALGIPIDELNDEQQLVLREVVLDPKPARRWLSPDELPIMLAIRSGWASGGRKALSRDALQRLREWATES